MFCPVDFLSVDFLSVHVLSLYQNILGCESGDQGLQIYEKKTRGWKSHATVPLRIKAIPAGFPYNFLGLFLSSGLEYCKFFDSILNSYQLQLSVRTKESASANVFNKKTMGECFSVE